ncbi:LacI family DNA-binding transcriptional regulator [Ruania halotolerans]|uniref:LacI family DNA-binding transcriptional regulator n=1 Tax=Ruania halotolerans TaxID=2897773 RepID=UPI001E561FA1|nr:LacI family DNA-binding transcriptional regulator [Ruania halotolerans]UFU08036.1 LacI family transcriptional regulator [Ruania halotolerans]
MPDPQPRPTIMDVARQAGVSKSLVSLALRGDPGVSASSRDRIRTIATDLGYHSNRLARALARGRSQLVGVVLNDLHSDHHTDVVAGLEDAAAERGIEILIAHGRRDPATLAQRIDSLAALGTDGIVVVSALLDSAELERAAARYPLVQVGRPNEVGSAVAAVYNDDEHGTFLALEHLRAHGHERIAHLTGSPRAAAQARRRAYLELMIRDGLNPAVFEDAARLIDFVRSAPETAPTAVYCATDRRAVEVVGVALDAGLHLPADLSVVGYDNSDVARLVRPQVTSLDQPRLLIGQRALQLLEDVIGGAAPRIDVVEPSLVVRSSVGPPRS